MVANGLGMWGAITIGKLRMIFWKAMLNMRQAHVPPCDPTVTDAAELASHQGMGTALKMQLPPHIFELLEEELTGRM